MAGEDDDILIRIEGRAGRITLNRPKALNALTYPQVGRIAAALDAWEQDDRVAVVLIDGAGDRGLCAGGDVRAMYDSRTDGPGFALRFWRDEYVLNARIARYPKPYVAIMDGIVMGGGIGLSAHGRHRIVTERSQLAMPETSIGLVPDVGGSWLLAHAPGNVGVYLGLTGGRMSGSDAIQVGFADTFVPVAEVSMLVARLCEHGPDDIDEVIASAEQPVPPSPLMERKADIDRWFDGETVEAILSALNTTTDDFARKTRADLETKSPTALKLALRSILEARRLPSLEAALAVEYRLTTRLFERGEFIEGVRALIVDKDRRPAWSPARVEDVTAEIVDSYFAPRPVGEDLVLPASG